MICFPIENCVCGLFSCLLKCLESYLKMLRKNPCGTSMRCLDERNSNRPTPIPLQRYHLFSMNIDTPPIPQYGLNLILCRNPSSASHPHSRHEWISEGTTEATEVPLSFSSCLFLLPPSKPSQASLSPGLSLRKTSPSTAFEPKQNMLICMAVSTAQSMRGSQD